ncbi:hypothetical protein [Streptomyces sp. NPDC006668]|uniref:hypothetical protein n=1 Tax=Streptomyces sp. NPDC006668 TaxID=3156903 RepID=UPI0033D72531
MPFTAGTATAVWGGLAGSLARQHASQRANRLVSGRCDAFLFEVQAPGLKLAGGSCTIAALLQTGGALLVPPLLLPDPVGFLAVPVSLPVGVFLLLAAPALLLLLPHLAGGVGLGGFLQLDFGQRLR